jgi:predicted nucleic acid-binding protein
MINLVIDSSVVIKWFDPEPYTADADRILTAYETGAIKLLAPEILPAEVGNIIMELKSIRHISNGVVGYPVGFHMRPMPNLSSRSTITRSSSVG